MVIMAARGYAYTIDYVVKDQNGVVLADTSNKKPIEILSGHSQVLPAVEKEIDKLKVGQSVDFVVPCNKAYGPYRSDRVKTKKISRLKYDGELGPGQEIMLWRWWGEKTPARVLQIDEERQEVTLDFNHKYVDKDLHYNITLRNLEELPPVIG